MIKSASETGGPIPTHAPPRRRSAKESPMPLPINLDALIHGKAVEWERLEFKQG